MAMHVASVKTSARMRILSPAGGAGGLRGGAINGALSPGPFQLFMMSLNPL